MFTEGSPHLLGFYRNFKSYLSQQIDDCRDSSTEEVKSTSSPLTLCSPQKRPSCLSRRRRRRRRRTMTPARGGAATSWTTTRWISWRCAWCAGSSATVRGRRRPAPTSRRPTRRRCPWTSSSATGCSRPGRSRWPSASSSSAASCNSTRPLLHGQVREGAPHRTGSRFPTQRLLRAAQAGGCNTMHAIPTTKVMQLWYWESARRMQVASRPFSINQICNFIHVEYITLQSGISSTDSVWMWETDMRSVWANVWAGIESMVY